MVKYLCANCCKEEFLVYSDVWVNKVIDEPHIELVCKNCGFASVFKYVERVDNVSSTQ